MRKLLIGFLIVGMLASVAMAGQTQLSTIKQELLIARTLHRPLPPISPRISEFSNETAYNIQNWLVGKLMKLRKAKVVGFKVAFTSSPSQKKFKTNEPAYGILLDYMELHNGAVIELKKVLNSFVEVEVGFRYSKPITRPVKGIEELKKYVDMAFPAIELPAIRFTTLKGIKAADVIADDAGTSYFIVGKMLKANKVDVKKIVSVLYYNGKIARIGKAAAVLGNPWESLLWLTNHVIKSGKKIKKGYLVITGTMTKLYPLKYGNYLAVHGKLGYIKFSVK